MKVVNSLKSLKTRDRNCQLVRRRGRVYIINKRTSASKRAKAKHVFCWMNDKKPV